MKNNYLSDWNMPDFSQFAEIARKTQEMIRSITAAALHTQEIIRPIVEVVEKYKAQVASAFGGTHFAVLISHICLLKIS